MQPTRQEKTSHRITGVQPVSRDCLVCGIENRLGLKANFFETENKELIALVTLQNEHQSYPGVAHGGISAAILDETIGRAIMTSHHHTTFGVTVDLQLRYRQPVPIGVELKVVGRITKDGGRLFEGTGELYLPDGSVAVEARGKFLKRTIGQITASDFTETDWHPPAGSAPETISI